MTTQLAPTPVFRGTDAFGLPLYLGQLGTFIAGTNTPQVTYKDSLGIATNTNPVILNARGECNLWLDPTKAYKFVLSDALGNQIWTVDNVTIGNANPSFSIIPTISNLFTLGSPSFSWANAYFGANGLALIDAGGNAGFYTRTAAEIAAAVTPTDYFYPPGDVRRYGAVGNGTVDDTTAITNALLVGNFGSSTSVLIPQGYTFKITSYIQIYSNTTVNILGTVQLTARNSGLFANGATNISILGSKVGTFLDTSVQAAYDWNHQSGSNTRIAPAIHLRSCIDALIDGVNLNFVCEGIQLSNATANTSIGAAWVLNQAQPVNNIVQNCYTTNTELGGITGYQMLESGYLNNYVGRAGDGGMWMMGASRCKVVGNQRVGPLGTVAAVNYGVGPFNVLASPNTWNDEQGLQFEACVDLLIEGNIVENMWAQGIDIKNNCVRVLCQGNRVTGCENASIAVREGDAVKNACHKVSIRNNLISNHGTLLFNLQTGISGGIRVGECYIAEVTDNTFGGYQNTPAIACSGPGTYQASQYAGNPHQASLTVSGNSFDFKSSFQTQDPNEIQFMGNAATWTATTVFIVGQTVKPTAPAGYFFVCEGAGTTSGVQPTWPTTLNAKVVDGTVTWICQTTASAILISGEYDSELIANNHVRTERYLLADLRANLFAAILLTYTTNGTTSAVYPTSCNIVGNTVDGWGTHAISVVGQTAQAYSGLACNTNTINACLGSGIVLAATHKALCNSNVISQCGSGGGVAAIQLNGSAGNVLDGVVCAGNSLVGGLPAGGIGGNAMASGIDTNFAANMHLQNNTIAGATVGVQRTFNLSGNHDFSGTTGFWRTNAGTPNGAVVGLWQGELLFDSTNLKWWACSTFGTTTWTQLTN